MLLRDVGRRVAELRAGRDLTQAELGDMMGVSMRYVQRVEAGRKNLTVRTLAALAGVLHVSVADLFAAPVSREVRRGRPPGRRKG